MRIHWSAIATAVLLSAILAVDIGWIAALAGSFVFFGSIMLHEIAHVLVARRFGIPTVSVELWGLGGISRLQRQPDTPRADGWIAAAGPIASVGLATVCALASIALDRLGVPELVVVVAVWSAVMNAGLAVFNLLPGSPLDGGRILRALRWWRHGNRYRAMREAGRVGRWIGIAMVVAGLALSMRGIDGFWLGLTGVFVAINASAEVAGAAMLERLAGIYVGDLMWVGVAEAGTDMDADSMLWQRQRLGGAGAVAVRDVGGPLLGMVTEERLWAIPADQRPWVMLTDVMSPMDRVATAAPGDEIGLVLPQLDSLQPLVSVWSEGRLIGVVPPGRLRDRLRGAVVP